MSLAEATVALDALLEDVFRLPIRKALDPNDPNDFVTISKELADALKGKTGAAEAVALREALRQLDVDWAKLSDQQKDVVVESAKAALAVQDTTLEGVSETFEANAQAVGLSTKASAKKQFGLNIQISLDKQDRTILGAVAMSQANYVRDEYGKRQEIFGSKAKEIVLGGLEKGLDRFAIAAQLKQDLTNQQIKRSENYWTVIAASFTNRARTYGNLSSYAAAQITRFTFEAVLDEVTSKVCRFMHGKSFSVRAAIAAYQATEGLSDPEDVKNTQPWLQVGRDKDGNEFIYPRGNKANSLATIVESGMGEVDNAGKYKNATGEKGLEAIGVMTPPLHGHCRSTIIPDTSIEFETAPAFPSGGPVMAPSPLLEPPPEIQAAPAFTEEAVPLSPLDLLLQPQLYQQGAEPETVQVPIPGGGEVEAVIPPKDKKALAMERFQALLEASKDSDAAKYGMIPNPNQATGKKLSMLEKKQAEIQAALESAQAKQEWKFVKAMRSAKEELDPAKVEMYLKNPKLLLEADVQVVKIGKEIYVVQGHEAVLAAQLLEKWKLKVTSVSLSAYEKAIKEAAAAAAQLAVEEKKPPPVKVRDKTVALPVAPTPPKGTPDPKNLLHEKTAPAAGSNEGGFYTGADGVRRYVKFYNDPSQAQGEALANAMYGALGFSSPQAVVVQQGGNYIYAAELLPGQTLATPGALTQASARQFMRGFVADVLMGNWDAAGASGDNAFLLPDGSVARIDNGGSFLMRAKAGRKPLEVLGKITEWERFFQSSNPGYSRIAKAAGYESAEDFKPVIIDEIRKVQALRKQWGGWGGFVDRYASLLDAGDRRAIVEMLEARSKLLDGKLEELTRPPPEIKPPLERRADFPGWRAQPIPNATAPAPGLRVQDLPKINKPPSMHHEDSHVLPNGQSRSDFNAEAQRRLAAVPASHINGMTAFTGGSYGGMRDAQMAEQRTGRPQNSTDAERARAAEEGFRTAIPTPMTSWRGIGGVPTAVVDAMIQNTGVFRLGQDNLGALSSTSWRPNGIFGGGGSEGSHSIVYQIHQQSGVAVDPISRHKGEDEILLSKDACFRILGVARSKDGGTIYIELEEIAPVPRSETVPEKKPRRRRKA